MFSFLRNHRRAALLAQPFPDGWESYLVRNMGHYRLLNEIEKKRIKDDARILIAEKSWEGCGGAQITDEMKVTITAQAALLLLGLNHDYFSRVPTVLVYPSGFEIPDAEFPDTEEGDAVEGQAVYRGPVILSWDAVLEEGRDPGRGRNVVIHEFAHQLDFLDGSSNGTPDLVSSAEERRWREVMTAEFQQLLKSVRQGRRSFLGSYAATNPGEFFAVASERFFTQPARMKQLHPSLHEILTAYYRLDPIRWFPG